MIRKSTIKKWNDHFKSLSKPEQRVAIAKDVIASVKKGFYNAESTYLTLPSEVEMKVWTTDSLTHDAIPTKLGERDVQSHFNEMNGCTVCGVGSCLVSLVKFTNNVNFFDLLQGDSDIWKRLTKYFSLSQLHMIEAIFEDNSGYGTTKAISLGYSPSEKIAEELNQCRATLLYPFEKNERLIAIMNNIVRNNGTFKPKEG